MKSLYDVSLLSGTAPSEQWIAGNMIQVHGPRKARIIADAILSKLDPDAKDRARRVRNTEKRRVLSSAR